MTSLDLKLANNNDSMMKNKTEPGVRGGTGHDSRVVVAQPIVSMGTSEEHGGGGDAFSPPRRRSFTVFAPGGNRFMYKRAFSARQVLRLLLWNGFTPRVLQLLDR